MNIRSKAERLTEVITLIKKLRELGFKTTDSGMVEFKEVSNKFVQDGKRWDGKIKFVEHPNITLIITLSSKKTVDCSIRIKH